MPVRVCMCVLMPLSAIRDNIETSKIAHESDERENIAINKIANGV